jgi:hypothetical protein
MLKKNWRNKVDYEFTNYLDIEGWAWEFLRRNPEYQQDWEEELPKYLTRESDYRSNPKYKDSPVFGQPIISVEDPSFKINPHSPKYLYKWGTYDLINPDNDKPFGPIFYPSSGQVILGEGSDWLSGNGKLTDINLQEGKVAVVFDLRKKLSHKSKKQKSI